MTEPGTVTVTTYEQAREAYRQKDLRQALYDEGDVVMADVLVNLHGDEHRARRRLAAQQGHRLDPVARRPALLLGQRPLVHPRPRLNDPKLRPFVTLSVTKGRQNPVVPAGPGRTASRGARRRTAR